MPTYIKNGNLRRATVSVTRYTDGIADAGYPIVFDIRDAFTYSGTPWSALGTNVDGKQELALLSDTDYNSRLAAFRLYVAEQTALGPAEINWGTDETNLATEVDNVTCVPGTLG